MSAPHSAPAAHASLAREAMGLLARMHEDNARLHRQFLETQESAQRALMALVEGRAMPAMAQVVTSPRPAAPLTVPAAPVAAMAPAQPVYVAPAPVAPFVTAPAPVALPAKSAGPDILGIVRLVISDKTGYPVEALGEDLALDADLGIDSIKRVEIMAGVQERLPDAPVIGPELMGTLRTLRQLVDHLSGGAAHAPAAQSQPQPVAASNAPASSTDSIMAVLRSVISDKTGYPTDALGEDLALEPGSAPSSWYDSYRCHSSNSPFILPKSSSGVTTAMPTLPTTIPAAKFAMWADWIGSAPTARDRV